MEKAFQYVKLQNWSSFNLSNCYLNGFVIWMVGSHFDNLTLDLTNAHNYCYKSLCVRMRSHYIITIFQNIYSSLWNISIWIMFNPQTWTKILTQRFKTINSQRMKIHLRMLRLPPLHFFTLVKGPWIWIKGALASFTEMKM